MTHNTNELSSYETFHLYVSSCHGDSVQICEALFNGLTLALHFLDCALSQCYRHMGILYTVNQYFNSSLFSSHYYFTHIKHSFNIDPALKNNKKTYVLGKTLL